MLTLAIIKPDALQARNAGKILAQLEAAGFVVRAARLVKLTTTQAEAFYEVHRARPFYRPLVTFMTSGPALVLALERDNAVAHLRDVRSEEHTSELQSRFELVCRLLLEKNNRRTRQRDQRQYSFRVDEWVQSSRIRNFAFWLFLRHHRLSHSSCS